MIHSYNNPGSWIDWVVRLSILDIVQRDVWGNLLEAHPQFVEERKSASDSGNQKE